MAVATTLCDLQAFGSSGLKKHQECGCFSMQLLFHSTFEKYLVEVLCEMKLDVVVLT